MPDYVAVDTSVIAHLTKAGPHSTHYRAMIGARRIAASFQVLAELLIADYAGPRRGRLDLLINGAVHLPHSDATSEWYARTARARRALKLRRERGGDAGDADVWIIASALEHDLQLLSHDGQQIALGGEIGLGVFTALSVRRRSAP